MSKLIMDFYSNYYLYHINKIAYSMLRILFVIIVLFSNINCLSQSLEYYIDKGLQNSPLLKDYINQLSTASLDSLAVKAAQQPQITGNVSLFYAPTFNGGINGYDDVISNGAAYIATIGVQQYIFNSKTLANKYYAINLQKQSLTNSQKISTNDLIRTITNQYLAVYSDYNEYTFNQEFLKLMHEEKDILKNLSDKGIYKQTDYLSLLIETQSQEILINQLMAQLKKDIYNINQLCGINEPGSTSFTVPAVSKKDRKDINSSPLLMQYKLDSLKIINEKASVDLRYHPKLSWQADAGFISSTSFNFYQHYGFSAGLNLSIPIYDGHLKKIDYQKLAISEDSRLNYETFFKNQFQQQVAQLNKELSDNKVVEEQLKTQLHSVEELINMSRVQLNYGNMSVTEFINAAKNYITVNMSLSQVQLKELLLTNELNYLMQ